MREAGYRGSLSISGSYMGKPALCGIVLEKRRTNGGATSFGGPDSAGRGARSRRHRELDFRCRQFEGRVRREPVPICLKYFSSAGWRAFVERPRGSWNQSRELQIPAVVERP